ncbi:MAG: ABC transporter substrate-binding protein [Chloroflexi bacterium]|nr:ABC transporter substrate-binding protein [Chloroflexota bacterium]MYD48292.1 ABC transporter substrate-binding protein [Chloroflexota bacterium]
MHHYLRFNVVALAALMLVVTAAALVPQRAETAGDPACPSSWPSEAQGGTVADYGHGVIEYSDFFTDSNEESWFVIRSSDSNGYTIVRAYPANVDGDGYVESASHETCHLLVRRPGDAEDDAEPQQITFRIDNEEPTGGTSLHCTQLDYSIGRPGGTLTYATTEGPQTFNLALANDGPSVGFLSYLFEGLTTISSCTGQVEPALAQWWQSSGDGLTWTFHLRSDVQWHDGTPFTAHDVVFTFDHIIKNYDPLFPGIRVAALDDYRVRFVLSGPSPTFLRNMGTAIYPRHILQPYVSAGTFASTWGVNTNPSEVIGTGPFTIQSYVPGVSLTLTRNPNYWLKDDEGNSLPYLDGIRFIFVSNFAAELARFRAGQTDMHGLLPEEYDVLKPLEEAEDFTIYEFGPGFGTYFLAFNMNPGQNAGGEKYVAPERLRWFTTREFRQAVAYSMDKARIINEIEHGRSEPQWSSISPAAGDFHNPNVRRYEYDTDRANALLDGLGWTDTDNDGIREDGSGNDIAFTLATTQECLACPIIIEGMESIGLRVNYLPMTFPQLVTRLSASYDWEAVMIGLGGGPDPGGGFDVWHSSGSLHLWHPNQVRPATQWEARIDDLYTRASTELNRARRIDYYHEAQEIIAEYLPVIYTTLGIRTTAVRNNLGNVRPTRFGLIDSRYVYFTDR